MDSLSADWPRSPFFMLVLALLHFFVGEVDYCDGASGSSFFSCVCFGDPGSEFLSPYLDGL